MGNEHGGRVGRVGSRDCRMARRLVEHDARLGDAVALEEAVSSLVHHGLVDRIGDRLGASSAAVRFAELNR
jgi:acyl-[acyl carrier protein]--UDP-N-acetylglucosamine O-acyltransferase